ncbi:MAG: sel1 repeat family protein [Oxalobacter sp.]|nr:sel1 repeat family protein [Oxalobacter sp.]
MTVSIYRRGLAAALLALSTAFILSGCSSSKEAVAEMTRKAEKGDTESMVKLADMYCRGAFGLNADDQICGMWMKRAAELGHKDAQYHLGRMFEEGIGMRRDDAQAYAWYSIAYANGYMMAGDKAQKISGKLSPKQHEDAQRIIEAKKALIVAH